MKVGETRSRLRQLVQMGCVDFAAKGTHVAIAPIIGQQDHDVGALGPCMTPQAQDCGNEQGQPSLAGTAKEGHGLKRGR